jgi:hypothetical protein
MYGIVELERRRGRKIILQVMIWEIWEYTGLGLWRRQTDVALAYNGML